MNCDLIEIVGFLFQINILKNLLNALYLYLENIQEYTFKFIYSIIRINQPYFAMFQFFFKEFVLNFDQCSQTKVFKKNMIKLILKIQKYLKYGVYQISLQFSFEVDVFRNI